MFASSQRITLLMLTFIFLFGCSAKQHQLGTNPHYQKLTLATVEKQSFVSQADLDTLLIQTRYASDAEKNKLYLAISRSLTQDAQYKLAKALLDSISNPDTETQIETAMLKTQQHLNLREFTAASRTLKQLQFSSAQDSYRYHLLRAWYYYERGSYPSYILALDTANTHLKEAQPQLADALIATTWKSIQMATPKQVTQLRAHHSATIHGWLALHSILDLNENPNAMRYPELTLSHLQTWREQFPNHAGQKLFRTQQNLNLVPVNKIDHIGVLLPLSGQHKTAAQMIQNAIFTTHLALRSPTQTLHVYNTDETPPSVDTYRTILDNDQIQGLIGPLTKEDTESLAHIHRPDVTTVLLNRAQTTQPHLLQYSLAPLEETEQLARNMLLGGYSHPLVLFDSAANSQETADLFTSKISALGGIVVDRAQLSGDLNKRVADAMGTTESASRHQFANTLSTTPLPANHQKRQDIDSIFLASDLQSGRQVIPLLKYHFAGDLPIFSTSTLYQSNNPIKNQDLNNAIFFDSPTEVAIENRPTGAQFAQNLITKIHNKNQTPLHESMRFYGLGIDAYLLLQTHYLDTVIDGYLIHGINGTLSTQKDGHIDRTLSRMVFNNGAAIADKRFDVLREHWRDLTHRFIR